LGDFQVTLENVPVTARTFQFNPARGHTPAVARLTGPREDAPDERLEEAAAAHRGPIPADFSSPDGAQLGEWTTATREQCRRGAPNTLGRPATATALFPAVNAKSESPKNAKTKFASSNVRLADMLGHLSCAGETSGSFR
jgi:hypothetical protein